MPGNPLSDPQWAPNLADTVERVVGTVRNKTTKPILMIARGASLGIVILCAVAVILPVFLIMVLRLFQILLDTWVAHDEAVWISYLALGALLWVAGLVLWSKRNPKPAEDAA